MRDGAVRVVGPVSRSVVRTASLLGARRLALPRDRVGTRLTFADGSTSYVFRETARRDGRTARPAVLVVAFRLRLLGNDGVGHAAFRRACIVNTPLFVGFAGFRSKLWLSDPVTGTYRGVYEWDDAALAADYARTLARVLGLVSQPGTVRWHVVGGLRRDEFLDRPEVVGAAVGDVDPADAWWRLREPVRPARPSAAS